MSRLVWDNTGEHFYETGVEHGVLYVWDQNRNIVTNVAKGEYKEGVVWNGLTGVTESPSGAEANAFWADNIKYLNLFSAEDFGATIEAYTYPEEFEECDGSRTLENGVTIGQQARKTFSFCYSTKVGNEVNSELGEKIHIVYGAMASPSERSYSTVNESPEAITFSWEVSTTPIEVDYTKDNKKMDLKKTAHLEIDTTKIQSITVDSTTISKENIVNTLKNWLYGKDNTPADSDPDNSNAAYLLYPDEVACIIATGSLTGVNGENHNEPRAKTHAATS